MSNLETKKAYNITEISALIAPVAADFGIHKMSIFGSYARGDKTDKSDIDFHIIDRGSLRGLFRLAAFEIALEELLKIPVDVVTTGGLFDDVRENVQREEIVIYDAK